MTDVGVEPTGHELCRLARRHRHPPAFAHPHPALDGEAEAEQPSRHRRPPERVIGRLAGKLRDRPRRGGTRRREVRQGNPGDDQRDPDEPHQLFETLLGYDARVLAVLPPDADDHDAYAKPVGRNRDRQNRRRKIDHAAPSSPRANSRKAHRARAGPQATSASARATTTACPSARFARRSANGFMTRSSRALSRLDVENAVGRQFRKFDRDPTETIEGRPSMRIAANGRIPLSVISSLAAAIRLRRSVLSC